MNQQAPTSTLPPLTQADLNAGYMSAPAQIGYPNTRMDTSRSRSLYRIPDLPAEERLRRKKVLNFHSRGSGLASVMLVFRWLNSALIFISVVLNWVAFYSYASVVLGVVTLCV
jgi:hypothetical protein